MIKFVTIWVLTVMVEIPGNGVSYSYQLNYATQNICEQQKAKHVSKYKEARCDFQQLPMYLPKPK